MVTGSSIDYWIGRRGVRPLVDRLPGRLRAGAHLKQARTFLDRYGAGAILLAHLFGHIRGFIAMAAGSSRFSYRRYLMYEVPAALVWCLLYTSLGYLMASNLDRLQLVLERIGLVGLALLVALVVAVFVFRRRVSARLDKMTASARSRQ